MTIIVKLLLIISPWMEVSSVLSCLERKKTISLWTGVNLVYLSMFPATHDLDRSWKLRGENVL